MYHAGIPADVPRGGDQVEAPGRLPAGRLQRRVRVHLADGDRAPRQGHSTTI